MVLPNRSLSGSIAALLCGLALSLPAAARVTCCDVDGKRTCGDPPPPQCLNRAKTVFDKGGVAKEMEAPLTAEQRAARDAAAARKLEEERLTAERERRDNALLASYTNEREIDAARDRALAEIERNAVQARNRLDAALKKQKGLEREKEFYKGKPQPAQLQAQIKDNEGEIAAQQKSLRDKDAATAAITQRFADDKARYQLLSGRR